MQKAEFDQYAETYDDVLNDSTPLNLSENVYFAEYKIALTAKLLGPAKPAYVLDFGCGAGRSLPYLASYFPDARLFGYDVSPASLAVAKRRVPKLTTFSDWSEIGSDSFDLIIAANVFHHIPPAERRFSLERCREALTASGSLFLFEHNPYNPATRWMFDHCPFDVGAEMLCLRAAKRLAANAGMRLKQHGYTLFFPRP
ncbi:MAG TPA: class I SAM-dependent methyltransferase, partial [Methylophilaceae bacterium]|nr:class I SAM-dependent methyltransferase [Methylophilaceae bacterium]